jgi:restriction endonuclease S subunit
MYSKGRGGTPSRYRLNREDLLGIPFPEISANLQEKMTIEINHRLETIRRLRAEAIEEWENAKKEFEQNLLGEAA